MQVTLKPLLDKALETGVDMIVADYLTMNDQEIEESRFNIPAQNNMAVVETSGLKLLSPQFSEFQFLISSTTYGHLSKKSEMLEIIDYMKEVAPDICFTNGFRQKLYTFMFRNMPHALINSYYVLNLSRKRFRKWKNLF